MSFRKDDLDRVLILFRTSNNAHGHTNNIILQHKIDELPQEAKDELVRSMMNIAHGISPKQYQIMIDFDGRV